MSTDCDAKNGNQNAYDSSKVEVIVMAKSDKTLKSNMNAKDDTMRKRTSLIIVPHQHQHHQQHQHQTVLNDNAAENEDRKNGNDRVSDIIEKIEKMKTNNNNTNTNTQPTINKKCASDQGSIGDRQEVKELKSNDRHSLGSVESCVSRSLSNTSGNSSPTSNTSSTSDDEVPLEDYQDLENGNLIDELDESDRKNCISNASSCIDDYSLREKLHNFVNTSLIKSNGGGGNSTSDDADEANILDDDTNQEPRSLPMHCEVLLSPHEAPLGRRYAEVAQLKR